MLSVNAMSRRLENLDAERQRRLFDATAQEFAEHGYEGASLNRILTLSGMSKSSLYYYFDDKADLFTTMIERALMALFREVGGLEAGALSAETFWATFEDRYRKSIAVVERDAWLVRLGGLFYQLRGSPRAGASTDRLFLAARRWVEEIVTRGQDLGVVRRDLPHSLLVDASIALIETLDCWVVAHWEALSEAGKERLPAEHIGLFRRLLEPEGALRS